MPEILLDFRQPNAASWFYLSLLLAVASYFCFRRFFSLRNWDLLSLFLPAPGLLITTRLENQMVAAGQLGASQVEQVRQSLPLLHLGYAWLLVVTGYFLIRCLADLFLTRRPHLEPSLDLGGLAFLGIALLGFLIHEVMVKEPDPSGRIAAHVAYRAWTGGLADASDQPQTGTTSAAVFASMPLTVVGTSVSQKMQPDDPLEISDVETGVARSAAILCHLSILAALMLIAWRHFNNPGGGVAIATLYLLLPVTAFNVGKVDHVLPSAFLIWAVLAYRRPWLAGLLFAMAGEFFYPLFLLPLWIGFYWGRGARAFLASFALMFGCLFLVAWWLDPVHSFMKAWTSSVVGQGWSIVRQAWTLHDAPLTLGIWTEATEMYRRPILLVYLAGALAVGFWPREKNLADLIALSVVLILGLQFWYADQGGSYIHWYLPLLLLLIFRPNLASVRPPELAAAN